MESPLWLIEKTDSSLYLVNATKKPKRADYSRVLRVPNDMLNEDARWLQIEQVDVEGSMVDTITINAAEKIIQQDADAAQAMVKATAKAHEELVSKKIKRQQFGVRVKAEVAVLNDSKGWTTEQTVAYMQNSIVRQLDALATAGALDSLKTTMQAADLSDFYDAAEKQSIIDLIQNYIDTE